ncbi:chaperonin: PROVISIONAL [Gigaspora margarita]|uniref:Chaperonin: PROVISIONAL n=1 Tax=Gigaspora margarita TaxID=4874 RepID=A0A8H4AUY1_GIGMA|nr:chaperonin: PROVISIONAL [Gigaspora margarita]
MSIFSLNKNIFEETHIENTQLQTDLSNLQFQYLVRENNDLSLSEIFEIFENTENNLLENEIWNTLENQDDNQNLEKINLLQSDDFKKSFEKGCCGKNCLQIQVEYSIALTRYLNFKNLSKSFQDMYLLGIIAATKQPEIIKNSKKSKLTTEYTFEGKSICLNTFKIIYGLVSNRAISFEIVMKVITFIGNFAKQNGLPSLEAIETNDQFGVKMRFNANYWTTKEKETKVLEWHKHIKWANIEQKIITYENIKNFEIENIIRPGKPNFLDITVHISWDYAQQIQLPYSPQQEGEHYFKSLYKVHLFGICDDAFPRQINYLIKESELVGKGANTVISLVHNYFELHGLGEKRLVIHADNCSGQTKNNAMIAYLAWRVLTGLHDSITYCFMVAGHTKFSPDRFFGLIKLLLRKSEVDNLDDLVKVVQNSTPGRFNIAQTVFDNKGNQVVHFYEWTDWLKQKFITIPDILKQHYFEFNSLDKGKVKISTSCDGEKTTIQIEKIKQKDKFNQLVEKNLPGLSAERQ